MRKEEKEDLEAMGFFCILILTLSIIIPFGFVFIHNNPTLIVKSLKILGWILLFLVIHSILHGGNSNERK